MAKVPAKSNIKHITKQPERNYDPIDEENGTSMSSAAYAEKSFDDRSSKDIQSGKGLLEISRRKIMNLIVNRIVFVYSAWDIFKEITHCVWCRNLKTKLSIQAYR